MKVFRALAPAFVLATVWPLEAAAHVRLEYPTPRYPAPTGFDLGNDLKDAPCGVAGDSRTTDPERISTFQAGETITVRFRETIGHPGHYRIAFDDDGQDDLVDPAGYDDIVDPPVLPILLDNIEDKDGTGTYEVEITLPNTPCDNCTLQLIQVMTDKPPYEIGDDDVYHQCADIVLTGPGSGGSGNAGGSSNAGGSGGSGNPTGGSAGSAGSSPGAGGAFGGAGGGTAAGGTIGSGGTAPGPSGSGGTGPQQKKLEEASCSLSLGTSGGASAPLFALLLAGLSLRARSRRSAAPRRGSPGGARGL